MRKALNAIFTIAYRDVVKFIRDPFEIAISFTFPIIFIGILGPSMQANLSADVGYSFIVFAFTGVVAQTMFQSAAIGVISLNEDRDKDLTQEIYVSPISRYVIIIGKILGETLDALIQGIVLIAFAFLIRIPIAWHEVLLIIPTFIAIAVFGGAFGVLILANLKTPRIANRLFPFVMFPQFFLAGVFSPVKFLPTYLLIPSRLAPMTYAVDLFRNVYYWGKPEYAKIVLFNPLLDIAVVGGITLVCIVVGTYLFVRNERNK